MISRIFGFAILLLYPLLVFVSLKFFEPRIISFLFLGIILTYFSSSRSKNFASKTQKYGMVLIAAIFLIITQIFNDILFIKIYPAFINIFLLILFSYSLFFPPTIIEKFARIYDKNLPNYAIKYTRNVTIIWCIFFILNASISLYTAFFASFDVWTLYNGLISYLMIGTLFSVEFIVRYFFKRKHEKSGTK